MAGAESFKSELPIVANVACSGLVLLHDSPPEELQAATSSGPTARRCAG